ncbi:acetyl-CoA synthetase-like protein [Testicularia cyperi]|uniref:Acetyl-CoA synthetase-like protein n=1 Tax=Testicularia cyperi TaxID=1882483 RepID=A0A317XU44_9BASI|nr:acetyl-CoA synthetase-like protein [Testicularia cyperi]
MSAPASSSGAAAASSSGIKKPFDDFKGDVALDKLVPLDRVDEALNVPGSPFEREVRFINGRVTHVWKNLIPSLRDLWLFGVQTHGPRPFIVAEGEVHTYQQVHERVLTVAHWLSHEFKVGKGDRVAVVGRNHVEFVVGFFAVGVIGAVPALVNAFLPDQSIYECIRDVGCKAALFDVERFRRLRKGETDFIAKLFGPATKDCVDDFNCTPGAHSGLSGVAVFPRAFEGIVPADKREWSNGRAGAHVFDADELARKYASSAPHQVPKVQVVPEDICCILYTSGTTGRPKGVASTQRQFLSAGSNSGFGAARAYVRRGKAPPVPSPEDEQSSGILLIPLFHSTGIQSGLCPSVARGTKICLMPKYDVDAAAKMIQEHEVQTVVGIGFMVRELMLSKHNMPSLQYVSHGGSSSATELPEETRAKNPMMLVGQGYGSTETNGVATALAGDDYILRPSSAGRAPPTIEIRIMDPDTLTEVKTGQVGEIWVKSPAIALGYWGKKKATEEAFTQDGYFRTGDLGRIDSDKFVYIMDRSKHIIIRGGENISGTEVESGVYQERRIIDCAAVPLPDERLGERVAVVCIPHPDYMKTNRPTVKDILEKASKVLAKHEVPEFVWIRDEPLERNANGKVDKAIVKEAVRKKFLEESAQSLKSKM